LTKPFGYANNPLAEGALNMNPTRRSLLVSAIPRRVKSKARHHSAATRAPKVKRKAAPAKKKPAPAKNKPTLAKNTANAGDIAQASKSEKSRDSILVAAARLFRRQGYSATTLRQIAATAEIKAASIYYYFDSKEAILEEVLHRGLIGIFESVKTVVKEAGKVSHRRRIGLAIEAHLVALLEASDFSSANIRIYGQLPEHLKKAHRPLRRAYAKYWDQLFLAARRAGEIRADIEIVPLRIFVLGALNWTIEWFNFGSKDAVLKLARRTELLIFDGLKKP
jgi:TetR/AcrR family transcriptional regulator, cholesterol catabolism regulator